MRGGGRRKGVGAGGEVKLRKGGRTNKKEKQTLVGCERGSCMVTDLGVVNGDEVVLQLHNVALDVLHVGQEGVKILLHTL